MSNLTPEQIATVKFAAAVIDAELGGRRTSQAARELRAMLPPDPVLQHQFDCPAPTRGGHCTCHPTVDYAQIHDHVDVDDQEGP